MKLRSQMLLAGALTLVVPLVGWQSVKQLYAALQQTRIDEQTLKVANMRLALSEAASIKQALVSGQRSDTVHDWYAEASRYPLFLDGYADDWQTLLHPALVYGKFDPSGLNHPVKVQADLQVAMVEDNQLLIRTASTEGLLHLFLSIKDSDVVYHELPTLRADAGEGEQPDRWTRLVNGDALELLVNDPSGRWNHGIFRALAPGPVTALSASDEVLSDGDEHRAGDKMPNWQGYWQESIDGYQLEISIPLPVNGSQVAFAVVDIDARGDPRTQWSGSASPLLMASMRTQPDDQQVFPGVFHHNEAAQVHLQSWTTDGVRARLFDRHGRLMADVNKLYSRSEQTDEAEAEASSGRGILNALLFRLFSFMVAGDLPLLPETRAGGVSLSLNAQRRKILTDETPVTSRYVTDENDRVLGTLVPIGLDAVQGFLLVEANEEHASAYAGSQLARLFSLLLLVSLLAGCGLLIFAMVLSSRIRRLSNEAQQAISVDGRVHGLTGSEARDEIGDLSRNLSSLLSRSAAYTQHLEALSSRLSHELRTPLSVVRTSIENIDAERLDDESRLLVSRASDGADRLSRIIKALVDSTRLEQSIQGADKQLIELDQWMPAVADMYQQIYPNTRIITRPAQLPELKVFVSPELLQQAMDKLVGNAVSFNDGDRTVLQLTVSDAAIDPHAVLTVANQGELPVDTDASQLFDPLVSVRQKDNDELHLGLGLYIVRLVAEHSGGEVFAHNQAGWVAIGLTLPLATDAELVFPQT